MRFMRSLRQDSLPLLVIAALVGAPLGASAEEGAPTQAAVDLAYEGKERFEAADYASALERFEKARALVGSPVFDLYVARSLKALGRWREALVAYDAAGIHLVDGSNVSFVQAQDNARKERKELLAKLPRLTVTAPHAAGSPPELLIDAEPVSWPVQAVQLDPGKHVIVATHDDLSHDEVVTLSPGQSLTVELPFGKPDEVAASRTAPADEPTAKRGISPLAWTAFGVGAAGLLVGATTGTWALVNMGQLRADCESGCPTGDEDHDALKNTTNTLATTANIGFIVAGVGTLLGVTFALTLNKGEKAPATNASLELRPTGTGLLLSGTF